TPAIDALLANREGEIFLGQITVITDPITGIATFNVPFGGAQEGDDITATATQVSVPGDPNKNLPTLGNTSEYSNSPTELQGKVTGGGWYYQPAGTSVTPVTPSPTSTQDRATFGFNAQYVKSKGD